MAPPPPPPAKTIPHHTLLLLSRRSQETKWKENLNWKAIFVTKKKIILKLTNRSHGLPSLKMMKVGKASMRYLFAIFTYFSVSIFTTSIFSLSFSLTSSRTGTMNWHGPHLKLNKQKPTIMLIILQLCNVLIYILSQNSAFIHNMVYFIVDFH